MSRSLVQREMIRLAEQQVELQEAAAREIAESNIACAEMIAAEIAQQTHTLKRTINQVGERMSDSISSAADQVSDAIDVLGDRLCAELSEIEWQLAQENKTLETILDVLRNSRNNETQQLIQQGVRHYVNEEYEEAEERFRRALEYDTTDYQVLMNLAYIEIHKHDASHAFTFFKKAVSLPKDLDSPSKARTFWATGRLYYAEKDYAQALSYAEQAFEHDNQDDPQGIYLLGVYAALAGKKTIALARIERSIVIDPSYFSKCAVDPDLQIIGPDIIQLLSRLSSEAESKARENVNSVVSRVSDGEIEKEPSVTDDCNMVRNLLDKAHEGMKQPSYSFCLRCAINMNMLEGVVSQMKNLIPLYSKKLAHQKDFHNSQERYSSMKSRRMPGEDYSGIYMLLGVSISYMLIGYFGARGSGWCDNEPVYVTIMLTIIWPLLFLLTLLCLPGGGEDKKTAASFLGGYFKGLLIAVVFCGGAFLLARRAERQYQNRRREVSNCKQQTRDAQDALSGTQNEISRIENEIKEALANIHW
jgi:tetratricopeptide (TPR) repeat protein